MRWWRGHLGFPPWVLVGALTLGLGTWGFTRLRSPPGSVPVHHLNAFQSFLAAVNLFGLSLGQGANLGARLNWALIVAAVLAAGLTVRALLAVTGSRIRRWYLRDQLRGHVIVCGAGALGTRLADSLDRAHDVVLIDINPAATGLAKAPDRYAWQITGDAALPDTLLDASTEHAAELLAVTPDDYINSLIVTAAQRTGTQARVMVQIEDPGLTRFFEERPDVEQPDRPATSLQVSPFSTNAAAARALLVDDTPDGEWHTQPGPLLDVVDGVAPHILLAGDHAFLDAAILEGLRRWRSLALVAAEAGDTADGPAPPLPPLRLSVYGPGAVERVERLRNRWTPEPHLLELYCQDLPSGGQGAVEADDWLRKLRGGKRHGGHATDFVSHAIVACESELDGIGLALGVGRALGDGIPLMRVSMLGTGELDNRIHDHTLASAHRSTTTVTSIPELASRADTIRSHSSLEDRLVDELVKRDVAPHSAQDAVERLTSRNELEIHTDPAWRFSAREVPLLRALLDDDGVSLDAFVAAGLAINLQSSPNLATCAERLLREPDPDAALRAHAWRARLGEDDLHAAAFAACCEYARVTSDWEALTLTRQRIQALPGDVDAARRVLELREFILLPRALAEAQARLAATQPGEDSAAATAVLARVQVAFDSRDQLLRGADHAKLAGYERVAIFAGAADASHAMTDDALVTLGKLLGPRSTRTRRSGDPATTSLGARESVRGDVGDLLPESDRFQALQGFDGVVLSGGTASGVSGVVARAANGYRVPTVGYVPAGAGDVDLYPDLRETDGHGFSELEPLAMWADILAAGLSPEQVSLIACPGGPITRAEILLARAMGARVGWLDPEEETPLPLDDDLPGGAENILQLPSDAMSVRALIVQTELDDPELRDHFAKLTHAEYRSKQTAGRLSGDPACAPWERLLPIFRASNRAQADDVKNKLAMIGMRIERTEAGGRRLQLSEQAVQLLAEMEHGRYVVDRLQAGWQLGDRDANRGRSPYFLPWTDLTTDERFWDVSAVRTIAGALESFGYGVTEIER
jgi:voltage-gated potassium channel Kch